MFDDTTILSDHSQRPSIVIVGMGSSPSTWETRCLSERLGGIVIIQDLGFAPDVNVLTACASQLSDCLHLHKEQIRQRDPKSKTPFWRGLRKYHQSRKPNR